MNVKGSGLQLQCIVYTTALLGRASLLELNTVIRIARANGPKIPRVRARISLQRIVSRVAQKVDGTTVLGDVVRRGYNIVWTGDVILRRDVDEPKHQWRQPGHGVVLVRDAVVPTLVLVGDEVGQCFPCYPRRAICVQICRDPGVADFGCSKVGDGATQAVAGNNDSIVWV